MDINITTPNLEQVLTKGNTNGDLDITSTDGKATLQATGSGAGISYTNGGVGEYANIQLDNTGIAIEHDTVVNVSAPDLNTDGNFTATIQVAAQNFKVNGTNGAGHIDLKHQASDATSPASSTALWADSNGDIKWKNDGNYKTTLATSANTADRVYTFQNANGILAFLTDIPSLTPYLTIAAAAATYEPIITKNTAFNRNFGTSSGDILLTTGTIANRMLITDSNNKVTTSSFTSGDITLINQPQTLTNKTMDGGSNTFTNIPKSSVNGYEGYALNGATVKNGGNPTDASTYFFGATNATCISFTASGRSQIYIPKAGTIKHIRVTIDNTAGTSETSTMYLRLNNTTDTTISSSIANNAASQTYSLDTSVAVIVGDYVEFKWVCPTWVTNPTNVGVNWIIYIE